MIKLYIVETNKFMDLIEKAKGDVFLVTDEGDRINMKSKLCQLYGIRLLLNAVDNGKITACLECTESEDKIMFLDYMMTNKVPA